MATQTDIDPQIIESLEFSPECESRRYHGDGNPATHWVDAHGCKESLLCSKCLEEWLDRIRRKFSHPMPNCEKCKKPFYTLEEFVTIRPLKG